MSTSQHSTVNRPDRSQFGCRSGRANWSGVNIAAMVVGFVFLWPIGLFMLFWILSGRDAQELPGAMRSLWARAKDSWSGSSSDGEGRRTGNRIFNEFQQTQYDRIRELKEEIHERSRRFKAFREQARRREDQSEFDAFMASSPEQDRS